MQPTLSAIYIYPVKGLGGIALAEGRCGARGLEHDRRWMVVDRDGVFLSQRSHPRMATVWTGIAGGALTLAAPDMEELAVPLDPPEAAPVRVRVWSSECEALPASREADGWLSGYLGLDCRLVYMPDATRRESNPEHAGPGHLVGFADAFAYLVTTQASLADLNARLAAAAHGPVPMNRFRPNLVVAGTEPWAEDGWRDIRAGSARLRAAKACGRCEVTTTDQATGEVRGPEPLATLAAFRASPFGPRFGVNLVTLEEGRVRVGDAIHVE